VSGDDEEVIMMMRRMMMTMMMMMMMMTMMMMKNDNGCDGGDDDDDDEVHASRNTNQCGLNKLVFLHHDSAYFVYSLSTHCLFTAYSLPLHFRNAGAEQHDVGTGEAEARA
jgi:hypothetical protein